jgi:cytochrome P450
MPRQAKKDLTLSDGTYIPAGTFIYIGPIPMKDPKNFTTPEKFDGYRFLKLRNVPGAENKNQFVTTSPDCTVFGHGHHACPGRFFASNELKLLISHLIMYYDWKLPDNQTSVQPMINGTSRSPNSRQKLLYKSREPEVPL